MKDEGIHTFLMKNTTLEGKLTFHGTIRIDGHLKGEISTEGGHLIVGDWGLIEADMQISSILVRGEIHGNIIADKRVEIQLPGKVFGNIQAPRVVIGEGGIFEGNCQMPEARGADEQKLAVLESDGYAAKVPERDDVEGRGDHLIHPRYDLPARCFAFVGNASDTQTWKLPYRHADGSIDARRLPNAIQVGLRIYRGTMVSAINRSEIPDILVLLARAAARLGKMPHQTGSPSRVYEQLAGVLEQLGRSREIEAS
ncbi:MAG: polymer-forming cytoskeletal protein [Deltaproteobacteria bacterium]|nr:polymer-forming cytoskeletal protein [Deltaproteobacteria bacterium]